MAIKDATGYTNEKIGAMFGWNQQVINRYLQMLAPEIRAVVEDTAMGITHVHVEQAKAGTTSDKLRESHFSR